MRIDTIDPGVVQQGFEFYGESGHVVSFVGGGGKTTLLYYIAGMTAAEGKKVLVTTTTHIGKPKNKSYVNSVKDAQALWAKGTYAVIGTLDAKNQKLSMPDENLLQSLMQKADLVLVEADGAKRCPCKVPREKEPVLLEACDLVTAVMGLSAIGKPIREVCFCLKEVQALLGVEEDHILTEADAARILSSEQGSRKGVGQRRYNVVLNQCDDGRRRKIGRKIAKLLSERGIDDVVLTSFEPGERSDQM